MAGGSGGCSGVPVPPRSGSSGSNQGARDAPGSPVCARARVRAPRCSPALVGVGVLLSAAASPQWAKRQPRGHRASARAGPAWKERTGGEGHKEGLAGVGGSERRGDRRRANTDPSPLWFFI